MRSSISDRLIALAASACLAAGLVLVPADSQAQLREGPEPELELPDLSPPEMEGEGDEALPELREKLPDSAVERAKMLDNLYALLATAEDEHAADKTSKAIMRLWAVSQRHGYRAHGPSDQGR